jgi:hypothetical protein
MRNHARKRIPGSATLALPRHDPTAESHVMICRLLLSLLAIGLTMLSTNAAALTEAQAEALIVEVRSEGLLTPVVHVRAPAEYERDVGLSMRIGNDFSCTLIFAPLPDSSLVPASRRADPLVEEFMLLHELAHCQHTALPLLFYSRDQPPQTNLAYHDLVLLAPWAEAVALFKEMFADTYAGAMLLARHRHSDVAVAVVRDFARWRRARELVIFPNARTHATAPALEALLAQQRSEESPAPDELREEALETASDAFLASISGFPFAGQVALNRDGTLDPEKYVGWMWRAAEELPRRRSFEHHQRVAARLSHPMQDLLARMRVFVKQNPPPDAMRAFVDELEDVVDARINTRVRHVSLASHDFR